MMRLTENEQTSPVQITTLSTSSLKSNMMICYVSMFYINVKVIYLSVLECLWSDESLLEMTTCDKHFLNIYRLND